jgi:hypothetical protein
MDLCAATVAEVFAGELTASYDIRPTPSPAPAPAPAIC